MLNMKVSFNNFGVIKKGDLQLNDLTILCGANNTGKTYVMYALYSLIGNGFTPTFDFVENIIEDLHNNRVCQYDIRSLIENNFESILNEISKGLQKSLSNLFGVKTEEFEQTNITLDFDRESLITNIIKQNWQNRISLGKKESKESVLFLDIQKAPNDTNVIFTMGNVSIMFDLFLELISMSINQLIFDKKDQNCFLLPAERAGLNLFFKELSSIRNRLLHHAQRDNINPMEILKDIIDSRYAKPISDYIEFLNELNNTKKQKSDFKQQTQYIQKKILNGKYEINRYGDISFLPYKSDKKKMPLHFTSSTVKTLFSLVFYLEHLAKKGDCLMIDEPELSLHPDNQRNLARLLALLVNSGVKVVVSTHSPYFVRELNNLIMLNKSFEQADELRKRYGYESDESLNPNQVSAYLFSENSIKPMEIDPKEGIIAETFDTVINNLNQSSDEIYYASQEEEEEDDE